MNILMIGPQGAGKGTQAEILSKRLGLPSYSPGQIYREEIAKGTPLGKSVEKILANGMLAPEESTNELMRKRAESKEVAHGYIFDGYPRNHAQFHPYMAFSYPTHVILLELSDEEAIKRLSSRVVCEKCGATYHMLSKPPKAAGVCDACGGKLAPRQDDTPEAIKKRLDIYHNETEPIVEELDEMGVLIRINGDQGIERVARDIQERLGK